MKNTKQYHLKVHFIIWLRQLHNIKKASKIHEFRPILKPVFSVGLAIFLMLASSFQDAICHTISEKETKELVKIIFDTDISGDWDDVGATATLHGLADLGEAEILGMCVSAGGYAAKWSPLCLDAINTYYGRPDIPIGVVKNIGSTNSIYIREIAENWPHDLTSEGVWDATELYRKILSGQPDTSVVIVSVGYITNIEISLQ